MSAHKRVRWLPAVLVGLMLLAVAPSALANNAGSRCRASGLRSLQGERAPVELKGALEQTTLSSFAVFRRAALPGDQIPALSNVGNQLDFQLASYYPAYIRQVAALPSGARYFVVPGFERAVSIPPAHCLPKSLRSRRGKLVEEQRKRVSEPVYCVARVDGGGASGGAQCEPFARIDDAQRVFESSFLRAPTVGLVPDGVTSVRIDYRTGAPIVASVRENAFAFSAPAALTRVFEQATKKLFASLPPAKAKHLTKAQRRRATEAFEKRFEAALAEAQPTKVEWLDGEVLVHAVARPTAKGRRLVVLSSGLGGI